MNLFAKNIVMPALLLSLTLCTGLRASADNIAEVAEKAGSFKTLLKLVKLAGLEGALTGTDELTVFAPTDDAFAKLPKKTVASLTDPKNKATLAAILKYHILKGKVMAADVMKLKSGSEVETLSGDKIKVTINKGGVFLNGKAKVVKTDIAADNGVIHVIDTVLLPPKK